MGRSSKTGSGKRRKSRVEEEEELPRDQVDEFMDARFNEVPLGRRPVRDADDSIVDRNLYVDLSSASDEDDDDDDGDDEQDEFEDDYEENEAQMYERLRHNMQASDEEKEERRKNRRQAPEGRTARAQIEKWGRNKSSFYQGGESEDSSSDQRLHEEEAERLQRKTMQFMDDADFDMPTSVSMAVHGDESKAKKKEKKKSSLKKKTKKTKSGDDDDDYDDNDNDSDVEQVSQKASSIDKELKALLKELHEKSREVKETLHPVLEKARNGEIETSSGLSFLELKNMLLLNYCMNLNFYLLLKAEGKPVKDHPVIDELVRLRLLIEKTKPIDDKIRPQVNRLLKTATQGVEAVVSDPSMMRANASSMLVATAGRKSSSSKTARGVPALNVQADIDEDLVYRAPRASTMFFDEDEAKSDKLARKIERDRKRAARSGIMKMVREEFADGPEEQDTGLAVMEIDEEAREAQLERERYEEEHFMRLRPTKAQRKAERAEFVDDLRSLDDFGDVERALRNARMEAGGDVEGPLSNMAKKLREAQQQQFEDNNEDADGRLVADSRLVSKRDVQAEAAYDAFLEEAREKREQAKRAKYEDNPNARRKVKTVAFSDDGKRSITKQIEQNRGIGHQKKSDIARVRNRKKFQKAEKKRASMTQKVRKEVKRYDGESAGINANVVRSTKLR